MKAVKIFSTISEAFSVGRVLSAVWDQSKLWFAFANSATPAGDTLFRSSFRLVQVNTDTNTVLQDFDVNAAGFSYFYPAAAVDGKGNLFVLFGYSSPNDYTGLMVTAQASTDATGTCQTPLTIIRGTGPETSGRYGDYFSAAVDPSNPLVVWVTGQYGTRNGWATRIASITNKQVPASTYTATISVSGLPSAYATHVMVDEASVGLIRYGESKSLEFEVGTSHTLSVDTYVSGPSGARYYCSTSSWTFSSSGSHAFDYAIQYYLAVSSKYGEAKGLGWYDSGLTAVFSVAPSSLEMSGIEGALGARYVFDHWTGNSTATTPEATIIMDAPESVEAVWRTDNTPVYVVTLAIICTLGIIVIVNAMIRRRRSAAVLRVKPVSFGESSCVLAVKSA